MKVLGIESSCDETGVAVYDTSLSGAAALRAHAVYSQIALHAEYGGVVPELASRDHVRKTLPLIRQTLDDAGIANAHVNDMAGLWAHPQLAARQRFVDVGTPVGVVPAMLPPGRNNQYDYRMDPVPAVGEHTDAILQSLQLDADALAAVRQSSQA